MTVNRLYESWLIVVASVVLTLVFCSAIVAFIPGQTMPGGMELWATATGLACVWLTRKEENLCWPIGIVSSILIGITFFQFDLPGQAFLNLLYFTPIQFYGWYLWTKRKTIVQPFGFKHDDGPEVKVSRLTTKQLLVAFGCFVVGTYGLAFTLHQLFDGEPMQRLWDSSIVVASVIAQWLLNRKRVEAWWVWLVPVNVSSVALYTHQGAYLYALMYVVFGIHAALAIWGWNRKAETNVQA